MPHLKQYYTSGVPVPDAVRKLLFKGNFLFLELWYDPDGSLDHLRKLVACADGRSPSEASRTAQRFFQFSRELRFDTCYGMLGGREQALVDVFLPEQRGEELIRRQFRESTPLSPYLFVKAFCQSGQWLLMAELSSPYIAYQYMLTYWESCPSYVYEHAEQDIPNAYRRKETLRKAQSALKLLLKAVNSFDSGALRECKRHSAVSFHGNLVARLRASNLPEEVQATIKTAL